MTLNIPTLCVMNGHSIAGGLIFALCHDFRIMREDFGLICRSEINLGLTLPTSYAAIIKNSLTPDVSRLLSYGGKYKPQDALRMKVVDNLYKDRKDLESHIEKFAKEYSPKGAFKESLKDLKIQLHRETYRSLINDTMSLAATKLFTRAKM